MTLSHEGKGAGGINWLRGIAAQWRPGPWTLPLILFGIHLLIVYPFFFPSLREINLWDEAAYLNAGRRLIEGSWPSLSQNPLLAMLYGLLYSVFQSSPFWLILCDWAGRVILFCAMWASAYSVGRSLEGRAHPLLVPGFLLVLPLSLEILTFPSDPLFAALAGFSLAQVILYEASRDFRHLAWASAWVGLSALARSDGLLLSILVVGAGLALSFRRKEWGKAWRSALGPVVLIVGGYALLSGLARGDMSTGLAERTYENFESGQQLIFDGGSEANPVIEAREEARRLFGTAEENGYSVLRAIERNPAAYRDRLLAVARALPEIGLRAYGIRFAPVLLLFLIAGVLELLRQRQRGLLLILLAWPLHLVSGLVITLFRVGHLQFAFAPVLALAALGLTASVPHAFDCKRVPWLVVGFGTLATYGLVAGKSAIGYGALILGVGFVVAAWLFRRGAGGPGGWAAASLTLLAAGFVVHGNYPSPRLGALGDLPEEQALIYLQQTFPRGTLIAAGAPGVVWAARMTYAGLASSDVPRQSTSPEFFQWMIASGIRAVYVDHTLSTENPKIWDLISSQIGDGLQVGFVADEGDIQVLLLPSSPQVGICGEHAADSAVAIESWRPLESRGEGPICTQLSLAPQASRE